jgi:hypothetical protein
MNVLIIPLTPQGQAPILGPDRPARHARCPLFRSDSGRATMLAMSERETGAESASAGAETEVTPEMVEAGLSALYEYESACLLGLPLGEMLVERVLEAALRVSSAKTAERTNNHSAKHVAR